MSGHLSSSPGVSGGRAMHQQAGLVQQIPQPQGYYATQHNTANLVPVAALDSVYASVFTFSHFNTVQSECFDSAVHSQSNLVVAAPTGCGKTGVLELAIVQMLEHQRVQVPSTTSRNRKAM